MSDTSFLRADLESAKEDLQRTHTELAAVQAEAYRFSLARTGVKQDLERHTCKSRSCAGSLKPQLVASQEYNNVAEDRAAMQCHNKIGNGAGIEVLPLIVIHIMGSAGGI